MLEFLPLSDVYRLHRTKTYQVPRLPSVDLEVLPCMLESAPPNDSAESAIFACHRTKTTREIPAVLKLGHPKGQLSEVKS